MIFKTLPEEEVLKLLENQENVLTRASKEQNDYFKVLSCPRCGGSVLPSVDPKRLFKPNELTPNYLAKCADCGVEFEPYTRIELTP